MTTNCDKTTLGRPELGDVPPPHPGPPPPPAATTTTFYGWSEICETINDLGGLRPQILDGVFMNMLADHFSDPSHIWDEDLHTTTWNKDNKLSRLSIFPVTLFARNTTLDRPAIIVKSGAFRSTRIAIGDVDADTVAGVSYTRRIDGTHTFIAAGGSGVTAKALAWELYSFFEAAAPILRDQLGMDLVPGGLGELSELSDAGNAFAVPVSVAYTYLSTVAVRTIDPAIKTFDHSIHINP